MLQRLTLLCSVVIACAARPTEFTGQVIGNRDGNAVTVLSDGMGRLRSASRASMWVHHSSVHTVQAPRSGRYLTAEPPPNDLTTAAQ
jgi:hypothetical protein